MDCLMKWIMMRRMRSNLRKGDAHAARVSYESRRMNIHAVTHVSCTIDFWTSLVLQNKIMTNNVAN